MVIKNRFLKMSIWENYLLWKICGLSPLNSISQGRARTFKRDFGMHTNESGCQGGFHATRKQLSYVPVFVAECILPFLSLTISLSPSLSLSSLSSLSLPFFLPLSRVRYSQMRRQCSSWPPVSCKLSTEIINRMFNQILTYSEKPWVWDAHVHLVNMLSLNISSCLFFPFLRAMG